MVPDTEDIPTIPDVGGIPSLDGGEGDDGFYDGPDAEEEPKLLPNRVVTVAHDHLFVASHIDFLKEVLKLAPQRQTLGGCVDYRVVDMTIQRMGITKSCARMFSRTDEEYRPTYELIRQGKMPKSETILGRLLNAMFGTGKKGVERPQKIDGSKLPDFDTIRRYLGPAGLIVTTEETGWFFKGFTLSKESP